MKTKIISLVMALMLVGATAHAQQKVLIGTNGESVSPSGTATNNGVEPIANGGTNATSAVAGAVPNTTSTTASAWTITPTLGVGGTSTGTLTLSNATGSGTFTLGASASTTTYTLNMPTAAPATSGQVLSATTGGAASWLSTEFSISSGSASFGSTTPYPTNTVIASYKAANAGHFTSLNCVNNGLNGGSCTTAPTVNVFDGTSNTGTAITCSTTAQTKGNQTTQAQTQTFAAGDIIGIYVSTQGGTCTAPLFTVTATATDP